MKEWRQIPAVLTLAVCGEWSPTQSDRFTPGGPHSRSGIFGEKNNTFSLLRLEPQLLGLLARSPHTTLLQEIVLFIFVTHARLSDRIATDGNHVHFLTYVQLARHHRTNTDCWPICHKWFSVKDNFSSSRYINKAFKRGKITCRNT
jgi:hypothetical protein